MDEEVINDLYSRAKSKGYSKGREDFVKLLHNDSEVINDSYSYVKSKGYGKDINSFYNLIGKVETEPSTQKKKFVSDSSLEDGSSELPKSTKPLSDMPTLDQQGLESAMAKRQSVPTDMSGTTIFKTDVKAKKTFERLAKENQKLSAEKKKYGDIFDKQLTTKPKAEESQYLKDRLSSIDTDLINKTEESVVPELEYQFGDLGFKFEETGALGDYVKVTAPNGKTSEISLDNLFSSKSKVQSEILQKFIKENTPAKGLFVLEKTMREQDKKFNSQKQVDESIKGITDDVNVLNAKQKQYIAKKSQFDKELNILGPNATKEQLDLLDQQRIALNDEMKSLLKEEEKIKQKSGRLSSAVGKYTINKSKQGGWFGGIQDAIARGQGKISAGTSNLMIDIIAETNSNEKMVAPEELKKQTLIAAKKLNIQGPAEGQSYKQWRESLSEDENDDIEDEIDDFVKKSMKSNTLPYIRIGAEEIFGDPETTKQWGDLKKQDFWGGAVLGLAESAPAMIGGAGPAGWAQRTAQMYAQVSDGLAEEMESNPEFKDVSENEKLAITLPIGITGAILEEFGLRNIKGSQGLINSLTLKALGKAGKGVTAKTFRELVENEVESAIARGAITITAAGAAEFETGAAQELADTSYKALYNEIKGKEMFDTPDSVQDLIENVAVAGAQEAVGGFILGVPTGVSVAYSEKGFLKMDDASFETFANMANDDKMQSAYIASLKNKIAQGELSVSEAKDQLNNYRNSVGLFRQLPDGLTTQEKKEAMNLLKEKRDLENYIEGKDSALVVKQKNRIAEINDSLTKLSETNAVQEQSTTEIPVQSETGISEEVEGRTPEAKPEVITEQVTQGEVTAPQTITNAKPQEIKEPSIVVHATADERGFALNYSEGVEETNIATPTDPRAFTQDATPEQKQEFSKGNAVITTNEVAENGDKNISFVSEIEDIGGRAGGTVFDFVIPNGNTATAEGIKEIYDSVRKDLKGKELVNETVKQVKEYINSNKPSEEIDLNLNADEKINELFNDENRFQADYAENKVDYFETEDATKKGFEKYNNYLNLTDPLKEYFKGGGVIYNGKKSMYLDAEKTNPISLDEIAELYHKAKSDNSNPELVQAVEKGLNSISNIEENAYRYNEYLNKIKQEVSSKIQPTTQTQENETRQQPTVQPESTGDRTRRTDSREIAPLEGSPTISGATGPDPQLVTVAEQYAADNGIDLKRQSEYVEVDEERAQRIAQAYEEMAHDPQNPKVKEAYAELIKQTIAQYQALVDAGYKFWFMDLNIPSNVEYAESPYNAMRDLRQNKEMGVFPTTDGFGTSELDVNDNPLLAETGFEWPVGGLDGPKMPVLANDLFRAVHDAFGHGLEGAGFRARGEENAWQAHIRLFTGPAKGAITSETRGQNSWLNYGPQGENNKTAKVEDTVFADQKTGLMPEWTWTEGLAGDMEAEAEIAEALSQELNEKDLPGYDRAMSEVEGIVQKSKQRKVSESKIFDNVMSYVTGSKIYEDATDVQREALVRDVRKRFGLKEKVAPSVNKLFGKIKDVKKVTMTEKAALIKQIKDRIKGAKDVIKKQKEIASQIADEVKELRTKGKITVNQAANIISKFSKVNLLNETSVSNFVDYISKVFADAEYDNKINIAKSKLAKAKQNIVTKLGIANGLVLPLQKLFSINPTLIPEKSLNRYLELLDIFSARQQVLNLEEKSVVTKDVQDILDEINNEQSLSDELADRFEASENKVFKDDVLDYAASVKNMLKNGEIDEKEAELMTKYKDRIVEKEERAKMTEEEIEAEKEILTKEIKKATVNPNGLPTRDEKELAKRFSRLIKGDAIKELTNTELKNVLKLIDNINNNYLPHYTQLMVEKMNDINNSKKLENSVEKSKPLTISKLYSEVKSLFTKKDAILEMIRRNPLFYIDQVLGDFKTKDIFNSILEKVAEGESNFTADFKKVKEKLSDAQDKVAKSFKLDANKVLESSFKMMTYAIQLEYDSNVGNKEVNPAAEYLKATIKHINDGKSQFGERDAEVLQKILDDYSDSEGNIDNEKLYNSFNSAEKNAIKTVREVNESLTEKAEYTAAIIRGQKINPLTNYIHLNVLHEHKPSDLTSGASFIDSYNNSIRPSTKAKSLIERTGKVSPLNFDIFSSAEKGAKFVLMDYNLTEPIRTARKTINRTISNLEKNGKMSKKNRQVINAINAAVEESIDNLLVNAYTSTSVVDDAVNYISKQGYRSVLAGTGRFVSEFLSNVGFIIISDPNTFTEGIKNRGIIMSADAPQIMQNVNSKETNRIFPSDMLSGRMIDTSVLNQASGVKGGTTKNAVLNRLEQFWNRTGKKYKNGVELTADFLISTPDKIIMRPIWFGSFANQFEKITGKKVDFKKIAENDEAYMEENREAIDQAKNIADERSVITGASSNAFTGILKGTVKPDQSTTVKAFNNFNNFMSKFLIYEYVTARTGIYAAMGNGSLTRKQGAALLGAVTTRMTVYSLLTKALGAGIIGLLFDDEEEEDKAIEKTAGQALASTFTSLILGRDFGNAPKTLINYGVERMNEEYLQALREGDYDPYKDSLQYTALPVSQKGKQISIDDLITRMSGSFGPAANTANLVLKKMYEPEKKEADAIERSEKEKNIRVPLEIAGNLGFVPLYKEIRQTVMKDIYEDLQNPMLRIERLKKTNPELYERFKKLQAKGLDKKFQAELEERRKRMEERLKKKIEEQAKKD